MSTPLFGTKTTFKHRLSYTTSYSTDFELQYKSCSFSTIFNGCSIPPDGDTNFSNAETDNPALLSALIFWCRLLDLTEMNNKYVSDNVGHKYSKTIYNIYSL